MSNEMTIVNFLQIKDEKLLKEYQRLDRIEKEVLSNIYMACYRFALLDKQIIYILKEAIRPYKRDILINLLQD